MVVLMVVLLIVVLSIVMRLVRERDGVAEYIAIIYRRAAAYINSPKRESLHGRAILRVT